MTIKRLDIAKFTTKIKKSIPGISTGFHDPKTWISTGSFLLNKLISGDFHRGIPLGKSTIFAGESGSGKSLFCTGNVTKNALDQGINVFIIDTENAIDASWLENFGIDPEHEKLTKVSMAMVDDVAKLISEFVKEYKATYDGVPHEEREKYLFIIDSLGMLMTPTDVAQFEAGELKGDMGRKPKALKALVTNLTNMFGENDIGLLCTNHTYASQDMYNPDPKVSGGCLVADTKVLMGNGALKNIQDIEIGDIVSTMYGTSEVDYLHRYEKKVYTITVEIDGVESVVKCSPEHKFLALRDENHVWVEAQELTDSDILLSIK